MDPFSPKESKRGWQTSMTSLKQRLDFVYHASLFSDVWIKVRKDSLERWEVIPSNKVILAASSPVFSSMFYGELSEFRKDHSFENISPKAFRAMLRYIYTDDVIMNNFYEVLNIYEVAKLFKIPALQIMCEVFILESDIETGQVCRILQRAEALKMHSLKAKCFDVIQERGKSVLLSEDFLGCPRDIVESIISLPNFQRRYGYEVIENVFKWAYHQARIQDDGKSIPRDFVIRLLPKLNFFSLSVEQFSTLIEEHKLVFTESEASSLLNDLIEYKGKELNLNYHPEDPGMLNLTFKTREIKISSTQDIGRMHLENIPRLYSNVTLLLFSVRVTGRDQPLLLPGINICWKLHKQELPIEASVLFRISMYESTKFESRELMSPITEKVNFRIVSENSVHVEFYEPYRLNSIQSFIVHMTVKFRKPISLLMANTLCNVVVCSPHMTEGHVCEFNQEILLTEVRTRQNQQSPKQVKK